MTDEPAITKANIAAFIKHAAGDDWGLSAQERAASMMAYTMWGELAGDDAESITEAEADAILEQFPLKRTEELTPPTDGE